MKKLPVTALLALFACASAGAAITVNSTGRGTYDAFGFASSGDIYRAGSGGTEVRNWFTFDLSSVTTPVSAASFVIYEPVFGFQSEDSLTNSVPLNATETFVLYDVTSTGLAANGSGGNSAIFADLGSGTSFGSLAVSSASDGQYLTITLNSAFLTQINARLGGTITLGGALAAMDNNAAYSRFLFNDSATGNPADGRVSLQVTSAVPEPSFYGAVAVAGLAVAARRRFGKRRAV